MCLLLNANSPASGPPGTLSTHRRKLLRVEHLVQGSLSGSGSRYHPTSITPSGLCSRQQPFLGYRYQLPTHHKPTAIVENPIRNPSEHGQSANRLTSRPYS